MNLAKRKNRPGFNRFFLLSFACLVFSGVFLQSCKKEYFELDRVKDADWNPTVAVPLVNSKVTVPDILDRFDDDDVIVIDGDGQLALLYYSQIFSQSAEGLMAIPDQTPPTVPLPMTNAEVLQLNGGTAVNKQVNNTVSLGTAQGEVFQEIDFKGGDLQIAANNNINRDVTLTITFPDIQSNGNPLVLTANPAANGSDNVNSSLVGYTATLAANNQLDVTIDMTISGQGGAVTNPLATVDVDLSMLNIAFSRVTGNFGSLAINLADSVRIRIFENSDDGTIFWEDPKIRAFFSSSLGADLSVNLNRFDGFSENTGQLINITGLPSPINITPPSAIGQTQVTSYLLDNTNSNIQAVTQASPTRIIYDVTGNLNPSGSPNPNPNFALDTSRISLDVEVELPFHGTAVDFAKADTIEVDIFPLDDDVEEVQEVTLRLDLDNGFPVEGKGQVYFFDSTLYINGQYNPNHNAVIDSMISNPQDFIIESGILGANGRVTTRTQKVTELTLNRDQLERLENMGMRYMVARGVVETTNAGSQVIKIYDDYDMGIRLGMKVKALVNLQF